MVEKDTRAQSKMNKKQKRDHGIHWTGTKGKGEMGKRIKLADDGTYTVFKEQRPGVLCRRRVVCGIGRQNSMAAFAILSRFKMS